MKRSLLLLILLVLTPVLLPAQSIHLQAGDRVVFVGDGLFENDLPNGFLEYALTTTTSNVTFRNIGWSGDTPAGTSRDHYTNPPTPFDHLIEQIRTTKPTLAFVGYGGHMAFEPATSQPVFIESLSTLLDSIAVMHSRVVLVSPAPHDPGTSPADAASHNIQLAAVSKQIGELAVARDVPFVDLFTALLPAADNPAVAISDQGVGLNLTGYALTAQALVDAVTTEPASDNISINLKSKTQSPNVTNLTATKSDVTFEFDSQTLPILKHPQSVALQIAGLKRGTYTISINKKQTGTFTAKDLAKGVTIPSPHAEQVDALLAKIREKNQTYFYQYRPQNETYLVGFREYEQGQNARELALLDPLMGEMENEIGRLSVPKQATIQISKR